MIIVTIIPGQPVREEYWSVTFLSYPTFCCFVWFCYQGNAGSRAGKYSILLNFKRCIEFVLFLIFLAEFISEPIWAKSFLCEMRNININFYISYWAIQVSHFFLSDLWFFVSFKEFVIS